jgi:hypothetical protein
LSERRAFKKRKGGNRSAKVGFCPKQETEIGAKAIANQIAA